MNEWRILKGKEGAYCRRFAQKALYFSRSHRIEKKNGKRKLENFHFKKEIEEKYEGLLASLLKLLHHPPPLAAFRAMLAGEKKDYLNFPRFETYFTFLFLNY